MIGDNVVSVSQFKTPELAQTTLPSVKPLNIIPSLSGAWCQLSWSCSFCLYIIRLNCTSGRSSITGTELVRKEFPLIRKETRAALYGYNQKELAQFDLEQGFFVSWPELIGSGVDGLRVGTKACDDQNTANSDRWKRRCQKRNLL